MALEEETTRRRKEGYPLVSILLLLDVALEDIMAGIYLTQNKVSILLLLDVALEEIVMLAVNVPTGSFNPSSTGCGS